MIINPTTSLSNWMMIIYPGFRHRFVWARRIYHHDNKSEGQLPCHIYLDFDDSEEGDNEWIICFPFCHVGEDLYQFYTTVIEKEELWYPNQDAAKDHFDLILNRFLKMKAFL